MDQIIVHKLTMFTLREHINMMNKGLNKKMGAKASGVIAAEANFHQASR
jgi:hypothetical protein